MDERLVTTSTERDRTTAVVGAYLISIVLLAIAAAVLWSLPARLEPAFETVWWMVVPIAIGFGFAERFLFNVELRREAISFSLSEVPTVLALAFLGPVQGVTVRVAASLLVLLLSGRSPLYKLVFNGGLFAFEAAVAYLVVRLVVDPPAADPGPFLVAATIATVAAAFAGLFLVCVVISLFEGSFVRQLRASFAATALTASTSALVGASAAAPALIGVQYAWVSIVPIVGTWLVMRRHGELAQEFRELDALHHFSRMLDESLDLDDVAPLAVREMARLVNADRVTLEVAGPDDMVSTWSAGRSLNRADVGVTIDRQAWRSAGRRVHLGAPDSFAVPIESEGDHLGVLLVAGHVDRVDGFDAKELERAVDLSEQLASTLRNGLLHASVAHAALYDELTGDLNRAAFEQRLTVELGRTLTGALGVMVLDLNQFKEVNDTLGHQVGDEVLVEFARRVRTALDFDDVTSRFGGDEFAILARRESTDEIRELAERILSMSYSPLTLEACDAVVPVSVGIAFAGDHDADPSGVLRRADIAMYAAKNQRSGIEVYREEIDRRTPARLSLLGDLRSAIERDELEVHYQPKIDLQTSTVIGAEALVRWKHPDRGLIPPVEFIGVAEESGLIRMITDVVLEKAIRRARRWRQAGYDLDVSVNLSALDLHDGELAARIQGRLDEHGLAPRCLIVEITESALMVHTQRTMATIDQLDLLGVRLSLDDFGTGYSSLSHLRHLPVSELKIDRSFVSDLLLNVHDDVIVRSTVDLGHNLGLRVVAEGIENAQVADHLTRLGCDVGQGYGISRPLAPELFDRWLETTDLNVARTREAAERDAVRARFAS